MAQRRVLVFDGDCAFCSSIARWTAGRLPPGAGTIPWQFLDDPADVGLTREQVAEAAFWIDEDGRAWRGHEAAALALQEIGGAWRWIGRLMLVAPIDRLAAWAYEVIARNRHRLPGGTPACRLPHGSR